MMLATNPVTPLRNKRGGGENDGTNRDVAFMLNLDNRLHLACSQRAIRLAD